VSWSGLSRARAPISSPKRYFLRLSVVLSLAASLLSTGCEKKSSRRLSAAEIHGITQELAAAAAARGATVRVRKSATDSDLNSSDAVHIALAASTSAQCKGALTDLLQNLDRPITRNKLTRDAAATSQNSTRILVRHAGIVTHEIEIETRPAAAAGKSQAAAGVPRLAIILDDFGSDRAAADIVFALHYPLTLSVLPGHVHSAEIALEAHRRGFEVMLHLPMESIGKEQPEAQELHPGMSAPQVTALVDGLVAGLPYAAGVNNHQGSQATADAALMSELMPVLRDKQLFYIDSRTTAATVAYDAAQTAGVPSAFRNVPFLDDVEEVAAVRKQLALAFKEAKEKREAIAIGHPHAATIQALKEVLPKAEADGIHLVVASELVH
jgi:polysaccharide deacetylase 2 family uncharacterized protein YibQ